jgi:hypothetical protein
VTARRGGRRSLQRALTTILPAVVLAACGEGGQEHAAAAPVQLPADPQTVVVRNGPYAVTGSTITRFLHAQLSRQSPDEPLIPPSFSACVTGLQDKAVFGFRPVPASSRLRGECQARYESALRTTLGRLIADVWLMTGARELLGASTESQRGSTRLQRAMHVTTAASYEVRPYLAAAAIRRMIVAGAKSIGGAQIASYYRRHTFEFLIDGERDVRLARTATDAGAVRIEREIAAGRSFASVVRRLPAPQASHSVDGLVLRLHPREYGEPNLNEAIFSTPPGILTGPIGTWFGYFVFEVTKVRYERVRPLRQVATGIRRRLLRPLQERAFARFVEQRMPTWIAHTFCISRDVVPGCRAFKGLGTRDTARMVEEILGS